MVLNQNGIDLIKGFEKLELASYQDQRGRWTVGYGDTGPDVGPGLVITPEQAEQRFQSKTQVFCHGIDALVPPTLTSNQYAAVCSLAYNIGLAELAGATLIQKLRLNAATASDEFPKWDMVRIDGVLTKSGGLLKRRLAEQALYDTPDEGIFNLAEYL